MEVYIAHILREENLVFFVDRHGGIFPPQERLCSIGAVIKPHTGFKPLLTGTQNYTNHTLHSVNRVMLG